MRDEVKELDITKLPLNIITNIHTSNQKGVHHNAIHIDKNNNKYFFDSYGLPPVDEILNKLGKNDFTYSTLILQNFGFAYCGQLSLYILYKLNDEENPNFVKTVLNARKGLKELNYI